MEYVDNLTFLMDLRVILFTVKKVFIREGIEFEEGHQPIMDYFAENKTDLEGMENPGTSLLIGIGNECEQERN